MAAAVPASVLFLVQRGADVEPLRGHIERHPTIAPRPSWCFDIEDCLTRLQSAAYDALVVQLTPFEAGARRLDHLATRLDRSSIDVPFVVLTSRATEALGRLALGRGALAHLALEDLDAPYLSLCLCFLRVEKRFLHRDGGT